MPRVALALIYDTELTDAVLSIPLEPDDHRSQPRPFDPSTDPFNAGTRPAKIKEALVLLSLVFTTADKGLTFLQHVRDAMRPETSITVQDPRSNKTRLILRKNTTDAEIIDSLEEIPRNGDARMVPKGGG